MCFWDFYLRRWKKCFWYIWAVYGFVAFTSTLGLLKQFYPDSWGTLTWLLALAYAAIAIIDNGVMEDYYNVSEE